jgi:hypothetical protein
MLFYLYIGQHPYGIGMLISRRVIPMDNRTSATSSTWKDSVQTNYPLGIALITYLPLRLGISAFVALLIWLVPTLALPPRTTLMARWAIPLPTGRPADLFLTPWLRFDALWIMKTVLNGYELREPNIQHMPLYPVLVRLLHAIIGGHVAISAMIISNLALILALSYVYRLVQLDDREAIARRATIYLVIFPTAFFYLIGYAESLFLLGSAGAFYYARRRVWWGAGLLGTISALARPQGVLILLPLAVEFLQQEGVSSHRDAYLLRRGWLKAWPLLLIPLSVALYALYLHLTFGLKTALEAFATYWHMGVGGTGVSIPGQGLWLSISTISQGIHPFHNDVDLAFAIFGLAMTIWAMRTLRPSYSLFIALNLVLSISARPVVGYPLQSISRYILPLFPIYILLGRAGEASPMINRLVVYSWLALLMFFSAQFALGGWVA